MASSMPLSSFMSANSECWEPGLSHWKEQFNIKLIDEETNGIKRQPTNAFGVIEFVGSTHKSEGKFLRLSDDTAPALVYEMMQQYWGMDQPRILISVTGGAKVFNLNPKLERVFASGLSKVAQTPGAWIISGGTNVGVMKRVGDALKGATNSCIGIATWGVISNRQALVSGPETTDIGGTFYYRSESSLLRPKGAFLDHNHTHFLLADDGTLDQFGKEDLLRGNLQSYIMQSLGVPAVLLMLEGGPGTIGTVGAALCHDPPVPVVVIKNSGRASDVLIKALDIFKGMEWENATHQKEMLIGLLSRELNLKGPALAKACNDFIICLNKRNAITIFEQNEQTDSEVDEAILAALLKYGSNNPRKQLKLSLLWDRPDIANLNIFSNLNCKWERQDFNDAMIIALAMNRVNFVKLLLTKGVGMDSIINRDRLGFLYGYRAKIGGSTFGMDVKKHKFPPADPKDQNVFHILCEEYQGWSTEECIFSYNYVLTEVIMKKYLWIINWGKELFLKNASSSGQFEKPFRHLFVWAVLNNMPQMAKLLWGYGENGIAKGLLAAAMCKEMVRISRSYKCEDISQQFQEFENDFYELTLELLDECKRSDMKYVEDLVQVEWEDLPMTYLKLAVITEVEQFVAYTSIQSILGSYWMGSFTETELPTYRALLGIFFPPYISTFEFADEENEEKLRKTSTSSRAVSPIKTKYQTFRQTSEEQLDLTYEIVVNKRATTLLNSIVKFWTAPVIKFYTNFIFYVIFLGLLSYEALLKKKVFPMELGTLEYILIVYILSFTLEELRQGCVRGFSDWWSFWNILDAVAILMFYLGFFFRLSEDRTKNDAGILLLALDSGLFIIRLLDVFYAHPVLGPYVVMIGKMFQDMMYFLTILFVFLCAYGVSVAAILKPQTPSWKMLVDVIFHPYYNIYGELFLTDEDNSTKTHFDTPVINKYAESIAFILLGIYLLFANVLLLNLLIAIFGNIYDDAKENSSQIWKFQRYYLVFEYMDRPTLPPPFTLISHVLRFVLLLAREIWNCWNCCAKSEFDEMAEKELQCKRKNLMQYEERCVSMLCRKKQIM